MPPPPPPPPPPLSLHPHTASAPQHSTGAPCAAGGQAILGRRQLPCDMVGASDGDNQGNSQARQSDRMAQPGNPNSIAVAVATALVPWPPTVLCTIFCFIFLFSSFLPCPQLKIFYFLFYFFSFFFSFSHAPKPKVETSYYFLLFSPFFSFPLPVG